jgi:putative transposase
MGWWREQPLRVAWADGWYHVFARGIERREIFADDRDRGHLLELLEALQGWYRVHRHVYALMENRYHAILQTPDANLSRGLQWLHRTHGGYRGHALDP